MARLKNQSKSKTQSLSKKRSRDKVLAQMRGESLQEVMTEPISDYDLEDFAEDVFSDEMDLTEVNDDEITVDTFEEDFNPNELYDPFDFNPLSNTSQITQKNNTIFLKRNGDRMKLFLSGHLRRSIVSYQRQYEMNDSNDIQERQRLLHSYMKPLFTLRLMSFIQEILDGFYPFEMDDFDFIALLPISTSKEIGSFTGVSKDTVRKYLKNLSLQLENGCLVSFNLITPEGILPKKCYLHFRRVISPGNHKQAFEEMVRIGKKYSLKDFLKSRLLFDLLEKWGISHTEVIKLLEIRAFQQLVECLRND